MRLRDELVRGCCAVLAAKMAALGPAALRRCARVLPEHVREELIENKLVSYRGVDPLLSLISSACPEGAVEHIKTSFAEAAGLAGQGGKTRVYRVGRALINWQSAYGSHTNDKKKELCGRAVGLRYAWDSAAQRFIKRPKVDTLILVLDGSWTQPKLDALIRAGWDEIFYADELEDLAAAVGGG